MINEAMLLEQNKRLRERNEELEEENRQLREAAAPRAELPAGLPHLTVLEEKALRSLLGRHGVIPKELIYDDMYGVDCGVNIKIVDVMVCHLRKKIPAALLEIETVWGRGYRVRLVESTAPVDAGSHAAEREARAA